MRKTTTTHRIRIRRLKRVLLAVSALLIATTLLLTSCSGNKKWNEEERKATREMVREWRELAYLNALSEEEFALFANRVTDVLENQYPSYVEFIEMPMVGDSVETVVIATIVTEIKASPSRLRHLFPYKELVRQEILPDGLGAISQEDFYNCLAEKVNMVYGSMQEFVWDAVYSRLDDVVIAQMLRRCAAPFWDVDLTIVEIN
ncbi:MAG: hypothetical protein IKB03_00920 [Tidjanibacter sp.]|nr:hypothetical protein [Tidjanibacter sp.]